MVLSWRRVIIIVAIVTISVTTVLPVSLMPSWLMRIQNVLSFMKVGALEEGAASMTAIELVAYDASFGHVPILAEVVQDVLIGPLSGHLADKKPHIDLGALKAVFPQLVLHLHSQFRGLHLPH